MLKEDTCIMYFHPRSIVHNVVISLGPAPVFEVEGLDYITNQQIREKLHAKKNSFIFYLYFSYALSL